MSISSNIETPISFYTKRKTKSSNSEPIRALIIHRSLSARTVLAKALIAESVEICGEVSNCRNACVECAKLKPDVVFASEGICSTNCLREKPPFKVAIDGEGLYSLSLTKPSILENIENLISNMKESNF